MRRIFSMLLISFLSLHAQAQQELKPRLSTLTKKYLADMEQKQLPDGYVYKKSPSGKLLVSAIIKVANAAVAQNNLDKIGASVGTKAGIIWTVQVPVEQVKAFTQLAGIAYIQIDEPVFPSLDVARKTTRVDSVHGGYGLPMPYSGKGVVVGVIDFGFDYDHPSFYDTLGTSYRVKRVWEMNTTGTPPSGYTYGHEITDTNAIRSQGTDNSEQTHGTCVAGMASGSGYGSTPATNKFRGMAYDADMVFVGVRRDSIGDQWMQSGFSDFIDGVNYIFNYAGSVSKPAVVNISWGSQSGPHDGTTLFNQACDFMTGAGKIVVMSAGNDGQDRIHLAKTFTTTDTVINTFLKFNPENYKRTWVDIWGDTAKTFCATVTLYHNGVAGNKTARICLDNLVHNFELIGDNGLDTCFVEFITNDKEFNDKPRMTINIFNKATDSVGISVTGTSGSIDMWDEYYYYGYKYRYSSEFDNLLKTWAVSGNTASTVSDMGAAKSTLLVGAYASKVNYTDIAGSSWSYSSYVLAGRICPFSSRGPMADGRIKPDIAAPGLTIATASSSLDTAYTPTGSSKNLVVAKCTHPVSGKEYYYSEFTGTSASGPAASGIVALMLQANPSLTPDKVKTILFQTAITDAATGTLPAAGNNTWGHGKINAYGAVKETVRDLAVYDYQGSRLDCVLFPNPGAGLFTIDYTGAKAEVLQIEVTDLSGRTVAQSQWKVTPGSNQYTLDLTLQPKGIYMTKVSGKDGAISIKTLSR